MCSHSTRAKLGTSAVPAWVVAVLPSNQPTAERAVGAPLVAEKISGTFAEALAKAKAGVEEALMTAMKRKRDWIQPGRPGVA